VIIDHGITDQGEPARPVRRFLFGYAHPTGFGSVYLNMGTDSLPTPADVLSVRSEVARVNGLRVQEVTILSISEVSPDGEVVT
jgi:hypothetical protein